MGLTKIGCIALPSFSYTPGLLVWGLFARECPLLSVFFHAFESHLIPAPFSSRETLATHVLLFLSLLLSFQLFKQHSISKPWTNPIFVVQADESPWPRSPALYPNSRPSTGYTSVWLQILMSPWNLRCSYNHELSSLIKATKPKAAQNLVSETQPAKEVNMLRSHYKNTDNM